MPEAKLASTSKDNVVVTFSQDQVSELDEYIGRIRQWAWMGLMGQFPYDQALKGIQNETTNLTLALWGGTLDVAK